PGGVDKHLTATPEQQQMLVRLYAFAPVLPTVLLALIGYHQYWHRVLGLRHREQELVELAATAQLAALRAQINPHFLFNSLNSIAQLIRADPDRAEACVERLAEMFRYVLRYGEKDFVPLAEELEMARAYLDIERARFGDRLRVETHVDPPSLQHLIPNLILQPLVENAVRHGLSRKRGGGTVRIDARLADGCLELSVGDDGVEALKLIEEERPDLVFLDVQMPGMGGFEVLKALREPPPHVVFSTAYDEYAIRAFEVGAVDYLLKPFGRRRVEEAVGRVRARFGAANSAPDWESVLKRLEEQRKVYVSQVPVHSGKRILIVPVTDVLWFGVEYRLVYAHTAERAFMTNYPLRELEERLDPAL